MPHGPGIVREIGVALLVAFVVGAVFLLAHLMYTQLVMMPRMVASGSSVLAVSVEIRWTLLVAAIAFVVYLAARFRTGAEG